MRMTKMNLVLVVVVLVLLLVSGSFFWSIILVANGFREMLYIASIDDVHTTENKTKFWFDH